MELPYFTAAKTRNNHRSIDTMLQTAHEALGRPEVAARLGHQAYYMANILGRFIVPNIRHGHIQMPDDTDNSAIPIIAMGSHEKITIDPMHVLPNQTQQDIARSIVGDANMPRLQQIFQDTKKGRPVQTIGDKHTSMCVDSETIWFTAPLNGDSSGTQFLYSGRPLLLVNSSYGQRSALRAPYLPPHEFAHIQQRERQPVSIMQTNGTLADTLLSHELEAYSVSAEIIQGYIDAGKTVELDPSASSYWSSLWIEAVRQRHNDAANPWRSSAAIAIDLATRQLPVTETIRQLSAKRRVAPEEWGQFNPTKTLPLATAA